jgi:hypothetical protein
MEAEGKPCAGCGNKQGKLRCSRCKVARYCTKECQRKHWKTHKKECNGPTATAAAKKPPVKRASENPCPSVETELHPAEFRVYDALSSMIFPIRQPGVKCKCTKEEGEMYQRAFGLRNVRNGTFVAGQFELGWRFTPYQTSSAWSAAYEEAMSGGAGNGSEQESITFALAQAVGKAQAAGSSHNSRVEELTPPQCVIVYIHGNCETVLKLDEDLPHFMRECSCSFLAIDYRGYGWSTGEPRASNLIGDMTHIYQQLPALLRRLHRDFCNDDGAGGAGGAGAPPLSWVDGYPPVFVMGRSMGSMAAIELARLAQLGGGAKEDERCAC